MSEIKPITLGGDIELTSETLARFFWAGVESGIAWSQRLPDLVEEICQNHKITQLRTSPEMRMNLVLFGESAIHGPVVLKLAQPHFEVSAEIISTRFLSTTGHYARLIDADEAGAWILLQRITPGTMLQSLAQSGEVSDAEATRILATLMRDTVQPAPDELRSSLPDLNYWLRSLFAHHAARTGGIPDEQLDLAVRHARELLATPAEQVLLHADFHHGNVLQGETGWVIIDPKGVIGHAAFEVGPSFYNPIGVDKHQDLVELFDARLDIFPEVLGIDRVTLWRNALVGCVLSDCWTLEDGPVDHAHANTITAALMQLPEASR